MPKFVLFTDVDSTSKEVYINPDLVVAIKPSNAKGCSTILVKHMEKTSFTVVGEPKDVSAALSKE